METQKAMLERNRKGQSKKNNFRSDLRYLIEDMVIILISWTFPSSLRVLGFRERDKNGDGIDHLIET